MLMEIPCEYCGTMVYRHISQIHNHTFCTRSHKALWQHENGHMNNHMVHIHRQQRKQNLVDTRKLWRLFAKFEHQSGLINFGRHLHRDEPIRVSNIPSECYLKEARAILEGKHWKGKNRCVKLTRDQR